MQARAPSPPDFRQLHLSLFAPHEIRAWEQEQHRIALGSEHRGRQPRRRFWIREDSGTRCLFDAIDPAVLNQPLPGAPQRSEPNCACDPLREQRGGADRRTDQGMDAVTWSDAAVTQLHEALLHHALKSLQARGNGAEKRETLQWIFAPQAMVAVLRGAHGRPFEAVLPQSLTPFSFEQCCRICGLSAERLRDGLMPLLREMGLGNVFNEIANGTKRNQTRAGDPALQDPRDLQHAAGVAGG